jgi:hypothetical protein
LRAERSNPAIVALAGLLRRTIPDRKSRHESGAAGCISGYRATFSTI